MCVPQLSHSTSTHQHTWIGNLKILLHTWSLIRQHFPLLDKLHTEKPVKAKSGVKRMCSSAVDLVGLFWSYRLKQGESDFFIVLWSFSGNFGGTSGKCFQARDNHSWVNFHLGWDNETMCSTREQNLLFMLLCLASISRQLKSFRLRR